MLSKYIDQMGWVSFSLNKEVIKKQLNREKDGFEVCKTLKNDERTSHIPIILLTAKADFASKIAGLERGADAYLSKPFNEEELLIRLEKLLESRQKMRTFFTQQALTDTAPSDYIRTFRLQKAKYLLVHSDLNVAEAAYAVGFKDPSYFSKIFQKELGTNPSLVKG